MLEGYDETFLGILLLTIVKSHDMVSGKKALSNLFDYLRLLEGSLRVLLGVPPSPPNPLG